MDKISQYHAHIYFAQGELEQATQLHSDIAQRFALTVGRVHEVPVGPHPQAMFQVRFSAQELSEFMPWLMVARQQFNVLIHGDTGNDLYDHTQLAVWLGDALPLKLDVFG